MKTSSISLTLDMSYADIKDFKAACIKEIVNELGMIFQNSLMDIQKELGKFIREQIMETPEYSSIIKGQLHGELGIVNPQSAMDAIIRQITDSMQLKVDHLSFSSSYNISGGISLNLIPSNYADLLGLPEAKYKSKEFDIPWLEWLLLKGNNFLVINYRVATNLNIVSKKYSRTGEGLMIKSKTRSWRVPPQYQGTPDNNFIMRAFLTNEVEWKLLLLFRDAILKNLENV